VSEGKESKVQEKGNQLTEDLPPDACAKEDQVSVNAPAQSQTASGTHQLKPQTAQEALAYCAYMLEKRCLLCL
jgi:hypothetical protein